MATTNRERTQQGENSPQLANRRHFFLPRFSLRVLLLAVTVFGVAFPIWYVWPYTERELFYPIDATGKQDKTKPPRGESIRQMKRVIGGAPVRHGLTITRFTDYQQGLYECKQEFVHGVEHGIFSDQRGDRKLTGQYANGKKTGLWIRMDPDFVTREQWKEGKRHGVTRLETAAGNVLTLTYSGGNLTHRDGMPLSSPLFERMLKEQIDSELIRPTLDDYTRLDFHNVPLADVISYLNDFHETRIEVDTEVLASSGSTGEPLVTVSLMGIDLATALSLVADDLGLVCDYRNGAVWITLPEDATAESATKK